MNESLIIFLALKAFSTYLCFSGQTIATLLVFLAIKREKNEMEQGSIVLIVFMHPCPSVTQQLLTLFFTSCVYSIRILILYGEISLDIYVVYHIVIFYKYFTAMSKRDFKLEISLKVINTPMYVLNFQSTA